MPTLELKATHKPVANYYDNLARFEKLGIKHEGAVRSAFHELLETCGRQFDWKLVPEYRLKAKAGNQVQVDGGLLDNYGLVHGYWEAKDGADDLDKEIKSKFAAGYALLHHPAYRTRYAENLKRELPRIPFIGCGCSRETAANKNADGRVSRALTSAATPASFFPLSAVEKMQGDAKPDHDPKASAKLFHAFAAAGKRLADLHVNYESAKEFPLQRQENKAAKLEWRVEAMKLSKDKASLFYNDFLTLSGIPAEVYAYRLGNRSALEWVIDQYRVTKDDNGNITSDPNRLDDEQYILRLLGQVITVSLETMKVVNGLPELAG